MAPTLREDTYRRISTLMHGTVGLSFPEAKLPLIASRLGPRLQRLGLADYDDYLALIENDSDGGEFQVAVDLLTTNETYFFREPAHFDRLADEVRRTRPRMFSVWSAASSFGDEAYSVAMLLDELQLQGFLGTHWQVLGTDISDRVLRSAAQAIFPEERLRDMSIERRRRHCLRGDGESDGLVMMQDRLRERVRFGQLNLCQPLGRETELGPFDVVFLRNVLIYFDAPTKRAVVDRVLSRLRPGGLFFIGAAEGRVACETPLVSLGPGAFRKAMKRVP